jgi:hypothetical protein
VAELAAAGETTAAFAGRVTSGRRPRESQRNIKRVKDTTWEESNRLVIGYAQAKKIETGRIDANRLHGGGPCRATGLGVGFYIRDLEVGNRTAEGALL